MPYYRARGRGQISTDESRSGKGFNYGGRRVNINNKNLKLTWAGPSVAELIGAALAATLAGLSQDALEYMQSVVPYKTGRLHDSCYVNVTAEDDGRIRVEIGANTRYAIFVELGSSRNAAQPYIRPTFDYIKEHLPGMLREELHSRGY